MRRPLKGSQLFAASLLLPLFILPLAFAKLASETASILNLRCASDEQSRLSQ
jgi:hypothetical protein